MKGEESNMSERQVRYSITDKNITVNFDGRTHIVSRADALADKLYQAIKEDRKDDIPDLISAASRIEKFGKGDFEVKDGLVYVNGIATPSFLSAKILKFQSEGLPHLPLVRFAENLQKNPSYRSVKELNEFLEKNDHPLTDDGFFIAYKRVREDFTDIHSGTFDNHPGKEPSMPRNQVNDDCTQTCSDGLHVANWWYAHTQFSSYDPATDRMVEVKVNPADVVSIPIDYNNAKMRVCKYLVLSEVNKEESSSLVSSTGRAYVPSEPIFFDSEEEERECFGCGEPEDDCQCEDEEDECELQSAARPRWSIGFDVARAARQA
jgi:hypothetical protein